MRLFAILPGRGLLSVPLPEDWDSTTVELAQELLIPCFAPGFLNGVRWVVAEANRAGHPVEFAALTSPTRVG